MVTAKNGFGISRDESIRLIVSTALNEGITNPKQIAYVLATAEHESQNFTRSEEIMGREQARKKGYGGGENYFGRGYVHITHKANYEKFDERLHLNGALKNNLDLAKDPEIAAKILVIGMKEGSFTGKKLNQFIDDNHTDYKQARKIVNGLYRADQIANRAKGYWEEKTLQVINDIKENKEEKAKQNEPLSKNMKDTTEPLSKNRNDEKEIVIQKLIDKAKGEIGYTETGNNHTKYAGKHIPSAQNKAWCDTFVDSMFIETYGRSNAQKMLGGIAPGTETSKENFQRMGLWHSAKSDYVPQPGDQIFFKNGSNKGRTVDHTGIVVKVENGKVYTIEGNTTANKRDSDGDGVESKVHNLKASNIVGYGTPNWDVVLKQNIQKLAPEPEKIPEKQPAAVPEKPVQEKPEKAEPSPQLSPQAQKFSQQCEDKLVECCNKKGITADSPQDFKNISMALTVKGLENGMTRVEKLDIESRNSVVMVFILSNEPHAKLASVSANEAVNIPAHQSIEKIKQIEQQKTQEQQMQHSQTQGMQR